MNVLAREGQDTVQLSAQRNRGDLVLFPIVGVLSIADFRAPFFVESVAEYRLEVRLRKCRAQEILVE